MELYPTNDGAFSETNVKPIDQFFTDAAAGHACPASACWTPNYGTQSQENPQNIVVGEALPRPGRATRSAARRPGARRC